MRKTTGWTGNNMQPVDMIKLANTRLACLYCNRKVKNLYGGACKRCVDQDNKRRATKKAGQGQLSG